MRDIPLFLSFVFIIPFIFKRPVVGALAYALVSLMNPHRLSYGAAYSFPFAMLIALITLIGVLVSREQKKIPLSPPVVMMGLFCLWMIVTFLFALDPPRALVVGDRVYKIMLMVFITILTVRTKRDVQILALVVAVSLGYWGVKGGVHTILSGGRSSVLGPADSFISDNNTVALALLVTVPLLIYHVGQARTRWSTWVALGATMLTIVGTIGSYSRGALVGCVAMTLFLWLKSTSKLKTGIAIAVVAPVILLSMPEEWTGRMHSIDNYQEDQSAQGRLNAWGFAINVANQFPLGGGPGIFSPESFAKYAPHPETFHVAHSIYFQMAGEHGWFGLALFLAMHFCTWCTGTRVIRHCKDKPELAWAGSLARMCQVSQIGYLTAGAFLTLAYYDLAYYVMAIVITLDKVLIRFPQADDTPPLRLPFGKRRAAPGPLKAPVPSRARS
ncbi:putative O-glycosylation ligase, exosortase A system-associated [Massilia varians]|uniref:putative O-glycosylation ligase, exosortase A system-associated n=1 Tax=Massilia varians TaxID=457921 RepID=UPI002556F9BC|nr:putative O-glycosylation ligase, exosortase A system-associated [Massilia varians]MDK6078680.1 putative O-glycosylation ligase, exosortase A system-associated [Massilia varians]